MYRKYLKILKEWLETPRRKPLVIRGARQVGKTWLVRQLAKETNKQLIEINLEKRPDMVSIFSSNDVQEIIQKLEAATLQNIEVSNCLLFLDEIQGAPELLAKLRWFYEDLPQLAVIATGSLLDFTLSKHTFSMPVGRISYIYVQPLSFEEFLIATEREQLYDYLQSWTLDKEIPLAIHNLLLKVVREYVFVGGLPEAINNWNLDKSFISTSLVQQDLLATYRDDFAKYAGRIDKSRLEEVLQAVPHMLGHKFQCSRVNNAVQAESVKQALDLLVTARLVHRIESCAATGLPIKATINPKFYKTILIDVGLIAALLKLSVQTAMLDDSFALDNIGGIAEQFVGQQLLSSQPFFIDPEIFYWLREDKSSAAEIDYIIQHNLKIIPIEVKSGSTGSLRSLHYFMALRQYDFAVRINSALPSMAEINVPVRASTAATAKYKLLSLPFYLVGQLSRFLEVQ